MNQLVSQQAGGALVFKGTVSEPATVSVGGKPATVTTDDRFEGQANVPEGTGQVDIVATDPSGNVRTSTYEVSQAGAPKTFTYDLNGNMTSDGTRTYEWDAENRLVAVKEGTTTVASYAYRSDGIRMSKTEAGLTTAYVLDGGRVVEERLGTGYATKHFQGPGVDTVLAMQDGSGAISYFTRDHLGSIREQVDVDGVSVLARRDYDPWGRLTAGAGVPGWAFTGRENEVVAGQYYYRARYYDPALGRFISEDPASIDQERSRYAYAAGNPIRHIDPTGLTKWSCDIRLTVAEIIVGWAGLWAKCEACHLASEKKRVVEITGGGVVVGGPLRFGTSKTKSQLDDHTDGEPNESVFEGAWKILASISAAGGKWGGSGTLFFQIGKASTWFDSSQPEGWWNLDLSLTVIGGGKVTSIKAYDLD